jgi:hypothetical protein
MARWRSACRAGPADRASAVAVALFAVVRRREQARDEALMLPFAAAAVLLLG